MPTTQSTQPEAADEREGDKDRAHKITMAAMEYAHCEKMHELRGSSHPFGRAGELLDDIAVSNPAVLLWIRDQIVPPVEAPKETAMDRLTAALPALIAMFNTIGVGVGSGQAPASAADDPKFRYDRESGEFVSANSPDSDSKQ